MKIMNGVASRRNEFMFLTFNTEQGERWFAKTGSFPERMINEGDLVIGYLPEGGNSIIITEIANQECCVLPHSSDYKFD